MGQLAKWKCHKIVAAGKMLSMMPDDPTNVLVEDVNGAPTRVAMPENWTARGAPKIGDYIVIYDDGYKSWSPAAAFEAGYAREAAT